MNPYTELPKTKIIYRRHDFLVNIARGKRVLHLGCTDAGLLDERFEQGELLHQRLEAVTKDLWGFDIDKEGIEFLRSKGFQQCIIGDVSFIHQVEELQNVTFDLILASEVVEHLQNPGLFFQSIQHLMMPNQTQLVVTVPNAFRIQTLLWLLRGVEYVHPDHNYWFSYVTICNLLRKNGFQIEDVMTYTFQKHHLIPKSLRRRFNRQTGQTSNEVNEIKVDDVYENYEKGASNAKQSEQSTPFNLFGYLRNLPKRILAAFLLNRTPFWGDGIIVVATVDNARVD